MRYPQHVNRQDRGWKFHYRHERHNMTISHYPNICLYVNKMQYNPKEFTILTPNFNFILFRFILELDKYYGVPRSCTYRFLSYI